VVGVAGFVTPGSRVDVLVSGVPPGQEAVSQGTVSKTVLQNIQVLSAGTDIQKDAEGKPHDVQVVNLLVTPEQAQTLSLAANLLKIQLVLRNPLDTKVSDVNTTAVSQMFGGLIPPPTHAVVRARKAPPTDYSIEVINGNKTSTEKFNSPEAKQ
jgi:pilus assembly protein CpaB